MTWTKLDDSFLGDPKFRKVGPHAELAFTRGLVYCNRYLTDGVIEAEALRELCQGFEREANRIASALVAEGLWQQRADGGYQVTNFFRYQKSRVKVMAEREANAERQRRHKERHGSPDGEGEDNGVSHGVSNGVSNALPARHPDPTRPVPSRTSAFSKRPMGGNGGPLDAAIEQLAVQKRMPPG